MPQARRQRDAIYRHQRGSAAAAAVLGEAARFVHYTTADSALRIFESKRIWMRNATCMADYREVQHGFDILQRFFSDKAKTAAFVDALDLCVSGAAMEAIKLFDQWWENIRLNTYITSVSEHDDTEDLHGRLSMWRAFGGNAARVALVVKIPAFSGGAAALNLIFSPVAYLTELEAHAVIEEVVKNIRENCDFLRSVERQASVSTVFVMLLAGVTCLKHEGFKEELEWRAIYTPKFRPSPLMESSLEVMGGVPQLVYKLPIDATVAPVLGELDLASIFDRLIIGPSPYPWVMYEAFVDALTKAGVKGAERLVVASGIPIRS